MDAVFTVAEVAKTLKVDELDAVELIVRGELGALELGPGEYRVTAGDLRRFINVRRADFRPTNAHEREMSVMPAPRTGPRRRRADREGGRD